MKRVIMTIFFTGCSLCYFFIISQTLQQYQYWIDADRQNEVIVNIPANDGTASIDWAIDLSGISEGLHHLYYRFKDSNNEWSTLYSSSFIVRHLQKNGTVKVAGLEYWIDNEISRSQKLSTTTDEEVKFAISTNNLREGIHTLHYRLVDSESEYSVPYSWQFFVLRRQKNLTTAVTSMECWVDTDIANKQSVSVEDSTAVFSYDATSLDEGMHTLYYRFQDNEDEYSILHTWQFFVRRVLQHDSISAVSCEYWLDKDVATKKTTAVSERKTAFSIDTKGMREGLHCLYYRLQDDEGEFGQLHTWQFFVTHIKEHNPTNVVSCEYWFDDNIDNKTEIEITNTSVLLSISAIGMKSGLHTLYYRFQDNDGEYSPLYAWNFTKINPYDPIMLLPYDATELNADMQTANPDYMAYPTILQDKMPTIECVNPE